MIGDRIFRNTSFNDFLIALFYCIMGVILGLVILVIALTTSAYTNIEFPTRNTGAYGFLMKTVQSRVPLARVGGGTVSAPPYNSDYSTFDVSTGAPIDPTAYYNSTTPFSTSAWWSRLVCQKAPTTYTSAQPFVYCGTFNLYRSKQIPSFAISIARPYALGSADIPATEVCGQVLTGDVNSRAFNISDVAPTYFMAPILWNISATRPYFIGSEMTYSAIEAGNMTAEMSYNAFASGNSLRVTLTENSPYIVCNLAPGSVMSLNSFFRDTLPVGVYTTIKLLDNMASGGR